MGRKKKKITIDPRIQLFMAEKGISITEEDYQMIVDNLNGVLESFPYPEKQEVVSSSEKPKEKKEKKKD